MSSFRQLDNGDLSITFTSQEAHVLINLTEQLLELLADGDGQSHQVDPLLHLVGISNSEAPPEDPVLRRLLPNAYDDEQAAGEFRRYTEHGLREKKKAHALLIYEALLPQDEDWNGDTPLDKGSIQITLQMADSLAWLGGLNDLRLALAVRLGFGSEKGRPQADGDSSNLENSEAQNSDLHKKYELMVESDPMKAVYAVYSWIGWLQQSLLEALDK
ncbi:MAG: DUF2017 domain-containing protein [Candidatus Nanopelagicaceae bacterium]|nr:DUF2017 domain-containing protein [Candidatus Nanopelagicaceae bacterium]